MEFISGRFIILSSPPGSGGKTREMIALSLCVLAMSACASFTRFNSALAMQPWLNSVSHFWIVIVSAMKWILKFWMRSLILWMQIKSHTNGKRWLAACNSSILFPEHSPVETVFFPNVSLQGDFFAINNRWGPICLWQNDVFFTFSYPTPTSIGLTGLSCIQGIRLRDRGEFMHPCLAIFSGQTYLKEIVLARWWKISQPWKCRIRQRSECGALTTLKTQFTTLSSPNTADLTPRVTMATKSSLEEGYVEQ
jgi:hypothetical protein